jgi:hypothetical protein
MLRTIRKWLRRIASSRQRPEYADQSEHGRNADLVRDPQYVTRIYGGGMEEGKWL